MIEEEFDLYHIVQAIKSRLTLLKESGFTYIINDQGKDKNMDNLSSNYDTPVLLEEVRTILGDCYRCKLSQNRQSIVFGAGNTNADILFIGEAPGADEDIQGLPFVGRAGQLLTKMIEAMGLLRDDVYIANIIKCRPPNNRAPEPDEITSCKPFLEMQIDVIKPKVIVGLGRYACQSLLETDIPMSKIRGDWREYKGIKFMPTFHPAYLLRNPPAKKEVWEDLKKVMSFLGLKS
jgi:uracil-DNA glycosylase family 4